MLGVCVRAVSVFFEGCSAGKLRSKIGCVLCVCENMCVCVLEYVCVSWLHRTKCDPRVGRVVRGC